AIQPVTMLQFVPDERERRQKTRVGRLDEPELRQQQRRGVEVPVAIAAGERLPGVAPGMLQDVPAQLPGMAVPVAGPRIETEAPCDARQAVHTGPAHGGRERVHALEA